MTGEHMEINLYLWKNDVDDLKRTESDRKEHMN